MMQHVDKVEEEEGKKREQKVLLVKLYNNSYVCLSLSFSLSLARSLSLSLTHKLTDTCTHMLKVNLHSHCDRPFSGEEFAVITMLAEMLDIMAIIQHCPLKATIITYIKEPQNLTGQWQIQQTASVTFNSTGIQRRYVIEQLERISRKVVSNYNFLIWSENGSESPKWNPELQCLMSLRKKSLFAITDNSVFMNLHSMVHSR